MTATRLFIATFAAFFVAAAVSAVKASVNEGQGPTVDGDGNQTLTIEHVSSTTSSITIRWTSRNVSASTSGSSNRKTDDAAVTVTIEATSLSTKMTLISPPISDSNSTTTSTFTLPELAVDSAYRVCVKRNAQEAACAVYRTIPTVRMDSVLAVLLTIAFIVLLVLIAVVCWRCAIFCATRTDSSCQEPSVIEDEKDCNAAKVTSGAPGEDNIGDEKAPLLVAGGSPGQSPNSDQQQPGSLYLYLTGPALDYKDG